MRQEQHRLQMPSSWSEATEHSNELENRLTKLEIGHDSHKGKIGYLERAVQALIWAVAALASSKSGDVVETLLAVLKSKL